MEYVSSKEKAKEWGVSQRRVMIFCKSGRVPGAKMIANRWLLPEDAKKPVDPRKKKW